jgi:SsrA-binding protein
MKKPLRSEAQNIENNLIVAETCVKEHTKQKKTSFFFRSKMIKFRFGDHMADKKNSARNPDGVLTTHRKAYRDFHILEKIEAGIELRGTEVKSIRDGHIRLDEAYAHIQNGQAELLQMTVQPYSHGNVFNHSPTRPRRLLLHKKEILRMQSKMGEKGLTLVPLKAYLKGGKVKIELALCKGKDTVDKRETLKKKASDMEARRALRGR